MTTPIGLIRALALVAPLAFLGCDSGGEDLSKHSTPAGQAPTDTPKDKPADAPK